MMPGTKEFIEEVEQRLLKRIEDIPTITAEKEFSVKLSMTDWKKLIAFILTVAALVGGWVVRDELTDLKFQSELVKVREEAVEQSAKFHEDLKAAIVASDKEWQVRLLEALSSLKETNVASIRGLELQIAKGILPESQRQIDVLRVELEAVRSKIADIEKRKPSDL